MTSLHRVPITSGDLIGLDLGLFKPHASWTFENADQDAPDNGEDSISYPENLTGLTEFDDPFAIPIAAGETASIIPGSFDAGGTRHRVVFKQRFYGGSNSTERKVKEFSEKIAREVKVLRRLDHPNIIHYYGVVMDVPRHGHSQFMIALSHCNKSDLSYYARKKPGPHLPLVLHIANALEYLHTNNVVHGHLKPRNILVTTSSSGVKAVLADFSCARIIGDPGSGPWCKGQGSIRYTAPEIACVPSTELVYFSKEADVYAFALVVLYVLSKKEAFEGPIMNVWAISQRLLDGERPKRSDHEDPEMTDEIWELLEGCWSQDPAKRPTAADIVARLSRLGLQ